MRVAFLAAGAVLITALSGAGEAAAQQSLTDKLYACTAWRTLRRGWPAMTPAVGQLKQAPEHGRCGGGEPPRVQKAEKDQFGFSSPPQAAIIAGANAPAAAELDNVK